MSLIAGLYNNGAQGVLAIPPAPVLTPPPAGSSHPAAHVKTQLELIARRTPRYLFRVWNGETSGGYAGLNTPTRITPLAFRNGHAVQSIHDIPPAQLAIIARAHIIEHHARNGSRFETPFSSWTQSLAYALQILPKYGSKAWISLLDTKKLPPRNVILWTPALRVIDPHAYTQWPMEFLAYGIIDESAALRSINGDVLKALCNSSLQKFRQAGHRVLGAHLDSIAVKSVMTIIQDTKALVGDDFALACVAYFRTYPMVKEPRNDDRVRKRIGSYTPLIHVLAEHFRVPGDWSWDHTIMTSAVYDADFEDVRCAVGFMRELVNAQALYTSTL